MGLKFLQDIVNLDNIQFVNSSGTNAGLINMDGNDLVLSNPLGDILLGDGSADVFIGDGVNNVDIRFEQSGSITPDNSNATLTIGGTGSLIIESPTINTPTLNSTSINNKLTFTTANGYINFDYEPSGETGEYSTPTKLLTVSNGSNEEVIMQRMSQGGALMIGHDDIVAIAAGDTWNILRDNIGWTGENVLLASEYGFTSYAFPNNDTTWSNRNEFRFYGGSATAADNGLYIGDGSSTQFIDLDRNLKNITAITTTSHGTSSQWNTAYGWGNHASAGYLTSSSTQTKYLRSDVDDTATGYLTLSGGVTGSNSLMTSFFLPQNPEGSHVKSPWFFNDMAYARLRGATITVTVNGGSAPSNAQIDAMFDASTGFWNMPTSGVTSVVVEMTNPPKSMQHGAHYGVTFGNTTWRANSVDIEAYYSGAYQEVVSTTSNSKEFVYGAKNSSGNTVSKIKWTFSNFNTTSMRIVSLFAYNYNATGMPSLYLAKDGGEMYGDIDMGTNTITDTKVGQWDTAYGWGDHSSAGYLTGVSGNISVGNINMTGELNFTGAGSKYIDVETLAGSNNLDIRHHNPTGNLFETAFRSTANGGTFLYYNGNTKFATTNTGISITGDISVSGTVDGRDIATDGTKLDTIATNADVTPSWVPSSDPNYLPKAGGTMTGSLILDDNSGDSPSIQLKNGSDINYQLYTGSSSLIITRVNNGGADLTLSGDSTDYTNSTLSVGGAVVSSTKIGNWNTAYGWGDHSSAGYLTAHPNISAASSVNNSGKTYIQDITLDSNGHVTGLVSDSLTGSDFIEPGSNGALNSLTCDTFNSEDSIAFNLDTDTNSTSTFVIKSDGSTLFSLDESGDLTIAGRFVSTYAAKASSGDILVDDGGEIKKRTTTELKTDLSLNNVPNTDTTNASNLSSGTVPTARLATTTIAKGGTGATTASAARSALGVDAAGTDNSTDVTLAGSLNYITISGQEITRNAIDLAADVTGTLPQTNLPDDMDSDKVKQICTTHHNFFMNSASTTADFFVPFNNLNESSNPTNAQYYNRTVAPYGGRLVKIALHTTAAIGSACKVQFWKANSTGTFASYTEEVTGIDLNTANSSDTATFSSSTFNAGDVVGVSIIKSGSATANMQVTLVWEYTL